jgi:hypothetical protein
MITKMTEYVLCAIRNVHFYKMKYSWAFVMLNPKMSSQFTNLLRGDVTVWIWELFEIVLESVDSWTIAVWGSRAVTVKICISPFLTFLTLGQVRNRHIIFRDAETLILRLMSTAIPVYEARLGQRLPTDFCVFERPWYYSIAVRLHQNHLAVWENTQIYKHVYIYIHVTYAKYMCLLRFLPITSRRPNAQHTTTSRTQPHVYNRTHCGRSAIPTSIRVAFIFKNKFDFLIYFLFLLWKFSYYIAKTENTSMTTSTQSYTLLALNR